MTQTTNVTPHLRSVSTSSRCTHTVTKSSHNYSRFSCISCRVYKPPGWGQVRCEVKSGRFGREKFSCISFGVGSPPKPPSWLRLIHENLLYYILLLMVSVSVLRKTWSYDDAKRTLRTRTHEDSHIIISNRQRFTRHIQLWTTKSR